MTPTLSVAAVHETATVVELVAPALIDAGALGGVVSGGGGGVPPNWIESEAPAGELETVVIVTFATVSVRLAPVASAESVKLGVPGVPSRSCDCTRLVNSGAIRTETPVATALEPEKVSNVPPGWRNSRLRNVPFPRAIRSRRGTAADEVSAGASVYVPLVATVVAAIQPSWARCQLLWW